MRDRIELAMAAWGRFAYDRAWRTILFSLCVVAALATQLLNEASERLGTIPQGPLGGDRRG